MGLPALAASLVAALLFAPPAPAEAGGWRLEKMAGAAEVLQKRVAAGEGSGWRIDRREPSVREQARVDGVVLVPAGSPLKMKAVRRRDGDQSFLLGGEGKPSEPVSGWAKMLPLLRREPLAGYRLLSGGKEEALLLAPHGAAVLCVEQGGAARIEIRRPDGELKNRFGEMGGAGTAPGTK